MNVSIWDFVIYEIDQSNGDTCRADPEHIRSTFINVVPAVTLVRTGARSLVDTTLPLYINQSNIPLFEFINTVSVNALVPSTPDHWQRKC